MVVANFEYQIVVQWDPRRCMYEAKFLPEYKRTTHRLTMERAVWCAAEQAKGILAAVKALGILPPPPDIGPVDQVDYTNEAEDLGEMVL